MSQVIKLLERMASDATLQTEDNVKNLVESSELSEELKTSFLNKDTVALSKQLDIAPDVVCFVLPAEDDEPSEGDEDQNDDEQETQSVVNG